MKGFELVIFDCDGVLVDSEFLANRESARLKTELGFPISTEENIRRFIGLGPKSPEVLEVRRQLPPDYPKILRERRDQAFRNELKEISGISELLSSLELPFCLASSGEMEKIQLSLSVTGLHRFFHGENTFSSQMVERAKPFPDLFLHAAGKMGAKAKYCLVIEDSVPGVKAAITAGMTVWGFTGGSHVYPGLASGLIESGAARIFSRMEDFHAVVAQ